jgi:hypothetical protein
MRYRRGPAAAVIICLATLAFSSCLARRLTISRPGSKLSQPLLTADRSILAGEIARQYNSIQDLFATVDMTPALGSTEKNHVTEYKDVRAYILIRKPSAIRLIGLYPVVRTKAFDMVSDGINFKLHIPSKNRFITGANELERPSPNKLENLRPQHFLDALMVHPIEPGEKLLMENYTDENNAFYILHIVRVKPDGELSMRRTVWFSRENLAISRQLILDDEGNILTDARYSGWRGYDKVIFPKHIEISRPRDEYGVVIDVVKMDVNKGVTDDKFVLDQPEGTTLQVVGKSPVAL